MKTAVLITYKARFSAVAVSFLKSVASDSKEFTNKAQGETVRLWTAKGMVVVPASQAGQIRMLCLGADPRKSPVVGKPARLLSPIGNATIGSSELQIRKDNLNWIANQKLNAARQAAA